MSRKYSKTKARIVKGGKQYYLEELAETAKKGLDGYKR
jgi:hypothetical protein